VVNDIANKKDMEAKLISVFNMIYSRQMELCD